MAQNAVAQGIALGSVTGGKDRSEAPAGRNTRPPPAPGRVKIPESDAARPAGRNRNASGAKMPSNDDRDNDLESVLKGLEAALVRAATIHFGEQAQVAIQISRHRRLDQRHNGRDLPSISTKSSDRSVLKTAAEVASQKIREAERDRIVKENQGRISKTITGVVERAGGRRRDRATGQRRGDHSPQRAGRWRSLAARPTHLRRPCSRCAKSAAGRYDHS